MNQREQELTLRHLDHLIDMRDKMWLRVHAGTATMQQHDALVYAVRMTEEKLSEAAVR